MRIQISIVAGGLLMMATAGHGQVQSGTYRTLLRTLLSHSVPEMGVTQAAAQSSHYLFLDAREAPEYQVSHIAQARWVGYETFDLSKLRDVDKSTPIVVYCSVGYRSEKIAEQLLAAGFQKVWNLYGGIFEWVNAGHPVYNERGPTEEVHAYDRTWGIWLKRGKKV
ncbi:MAG: rhodanese-like domain-containing protein, partial [Saprospiraceae bacterium]|nr:rhodanese-like domain-containing protein [Saprospiraceae bacterium]